MHPAVVEVTPHDDHLLSVVFENGERGWLDIKPFLEFGVFQKIKDDHAFRQVRGDNMKAIDIEKEKIGLAQIFGFARKESVLLLVNGEEFILSRADDFEAEVEAIRNSQSFSIFFRQKDEMQKKISY